MRFTRSAAALLAALLGALAGPVLAQDSTPPPIPLVEARGQRMNEIDAQARIAFHAFIPSPSYTEVALLPAFHSYDSDSPENRGIGFEYVEAGVSYVLREWPLSGGSLGSYPSIAPEGTCTTGHLALGTPQHIRAIAWTTETLVFALQPDVPSGTNPNVRSLKAEWARLVKRGACR